MIRSIVLSRLSLRVRQGCVGGFRRPHWRSTQTLFVLRSRFVRLGGLVAFLVVGWSAGVATRASAATDDVTTAAHWVEASQLPGGLCVLTGRVDGDTAVAVAKQGRFLVHCLVSDSEQCDQLRQSIRASGLYGTVSADLLT